MCWVRGDQAKLLRASCHFVLRIFGFHVGTNYMVKFLQLCTAHGEDDTVSLALKFGGRFSYLSRLSACSTQKKNIEVHSAVSVAQVCCSILRSRPTEHMDDMHVLALTKGHFTHGPRAVTL